MLARSGNPAPRDSPTGFLSVSVSPVTYDGSETERARDDPVTVRRVNAAITLPKSFARRVGYRAIGARTGCKGDLGRRV